MKEQARLRTEEGFEALRRLLPKSDDETARQIEAKFATANIPKAYQDEFLRFVRLLEGPELPAALIVAEWPNPKLIVPPPEALASKIKTGAALLSTTHKEFYLAACTNPLLFTTDPRHIHANAVAIAETIGVPLDRYLKVMLNRPDLMTRSPKDMLRIIKIKAKALGLSPSTLKAMIAEVPLIAFLKIRPLLSNRDFIARLLGVDPADIVQAATKCPQLLLLMPARAETNLRDAATLLGMSPSAYIPRIRKWPQLLLLRRKDILFNAKNLSRVLQVPQSNLYATARFAPAILSLPPGRGMQKITALSKTLDLEEHRAIAFLMKFPRFFFLSTYHATQSIKTAATASHMSAADFIEAALLEPSLILNDEHRHSVGVPSTPPEVT